MHMIYRFTVNPFVVQISVGILIGNIFHFVKARIVYGCLKTKKVKEYISFTFHRHCTSPTSFKQSSNPYYLSHFPRDE